MPRTCLACSSPNRVAIDTALASGEALRNIAKRVSISPTALLRHKAHVGQAIVKASEKREESIGNAVSNRLEKLYQRAERILSDAEASGDGRLALAALREVRETLAGIYSLASKAQQDAEGLATFIVQVGFAPGPAMHALSPGDPIPPITEIPVPKRDSGDTV